ncbi:RNI-like superfamily protein [Rhynchospora pubera]|uniref:RNI-like superfamily protein n=1 Tax=Rhynchospora pubera TaxID=906938 RepID=A0AAV8GX69_9POAL|nr:RNI-like superfamily protein [Rhynchospora pubera]
MGTGGKDFSRLYKYDEARKKWRRSSLNGSLTEMTKVAVDWGGNSVEQLLIGSFCDNDLLDYIADTASNLKRLSLIGLGNSAYISHGRMAKALGRLKQLEELEFERCKLPQGVIMNAIGVMCPQLKRLKLQKPSFERIYYEEESNLTLGIPKTMHRLEYLQLLCLCTRNEELMKILAKCPNLKMLDLRGSTVYKSYDSSIRVKDDKLRAQCSRILTLMLSHGMSSQTHKQYDDISDDACCLIHWMPTSKHYCLC